MKLITSGEIPGLIKDGDLVVTTGIALGGYAEKAVLEIEKSFLESGHPKNLTFFWPTGNGNMKDRGLCHLCHEGLMVRGIGGHFSGCGTAMARFCRDNKAAIYNWPQGVCIDMLRAVSAHHPGVITKTGLGTFMDPRLDGGKMNTAAKENFIEVVTIDGQEWLHYKLPQKINVVFIRGTYADEDGNISMDKEAYKLSQINAAAAAKACGGIVICQVLDIVKAGSIHPKDVAVPAMLVDYVYVSEQEYHWQTGATVYDPVYCGDEKVPGSVFPKAPFNIRKVIARRAAMALREGEIVNLGVGNPQVVSAVLAEEGCLDKIILTVDSGCIGGIPGQKMNFGVAVNAQAIIESSAMFNIYAGGTLDTGFLGFIEIGENGDLNASNRHGLGIGIGGFMDITVGASRLVFMGTFTGGIKKNTQPEYEIRDGKLFITREGDQKKFVNKIGQVSFSAHQALLDGKEVIYITERAVFVLTKDGLKLTEIAPGVDIKKDILDQMEFMPIIDKNLKLMPQGIFREEWGELKIGRKNQ